MTTPAALRELADRLDAWGRECEDLDDPHSNIPGVFLSDLISGDFYDAMKEAATQLRTAASEGGEAVAQIIHSADEVSRMVILPAGIPIGFGTHDLYLHPPEVARDAARELLSSLNYLIGELCNESGAAQVDGNVEREKALDWATDRLREIADAATSDAALRARAVG